MLQQRLWSTGDYNKQAWSNGYKIHLELTELWTEGNASVVNYHFFISNKDNVFSTPPRSWNISIGGQTIAIQNFTFYLAELNDTQSIAEGQITVEHNSDGTLNMPFSVSIPNLEAVNTHAPPAMSIVGSWALTPIELTPPIISASVMDINDITIALTGDSNKLVRYYSTAQATMSAEAQGEASIDQDLYIIRNGNDTEYGTEAIFYNVEDNAFRFSAQDSEGNIGTAIVTPTMVNYVKLTCNIENEKPDANGNMDMMCSGSFFNGSFGEVENTLSVKCRYKKQGGTFGDWITMRIVENGDYYGAYASFQIPNFDYRAVYVFECKAADKLATVNATPSSVKSLPVFHWSGDDFVFEVPVTFNAGTSEAAGDKTIDGDLNVTGDLRLKGSGNYGNTLRFGDGDYCYITETTDDVMSIHAKQINITTTNGVSVDGGHIETTEAGLWTPEISANVSAVSSYSVQEGWFQKVGQCVTVGFNIKATIKSGYESYSFLITGLPFTPMCNAFGGGIAHNIYLSSGGFAFEGWCANTDGNVTGRLQPCNNATAGNLQIASTTYFPEGGGTMTLSGTICYLTNG